MDSLVGGFREPALHLFIGIGDGTVSVTPPEPFPDIVHGTFDLSFDPGAIRRAGFGLKPIGLGKMEEL